MRRYVYGLLSLGSLCILLSAAGASPLSPGTAPRTRRRPASAPPASRVEALDKDHDGILSAEEIQSASESLKKTRPGTATATHGRRAPPAGGPGRPRDVALAMPGRGERGRGGPNAAVRRARPGP